VPGEPPRIRPLTIADAAELTALLVANREFLRPFEPERDGAYFTLAGQRTRLRLADEERRAGRLHRFAILDDAGALAGAIALQNVVRAAAQSATLGYWVDRERNGRGLASAAVAAVVAQAFGDLRLHRLQAPVLADNRRSRRVLAKNRFTPIGVARGYLRIDGAWRDHVLFERLRED
jgi:[ribosomal protein S5]-alanine N-acetyltransferase